MVLLTQYNGAILGPIAKVLGWIFNGLFELIANFGIYNIGLTIILFTIIIKLIMLPLTVKQMKFSKMSNIMNPELTALQKKYKGKTDQDSMMKMREEQNAIYEKYGTSPTGGCVQLIIQMPILFALYRVMQNIPAYVGAVKDVFYNMLSGTNGLMAQENFTAIMAENFGTTYGDYSTIDKTIDAMNYFSTAQWQQLEELFPSCASVISENVDNLFGMYNFLGINLSVKPEIMAVSVLIPILTALTQWISMKTVSNKNSNGNMDDNPAMKSMQTMNTIMPIMTGFIALSLPSALGLYWIATAVCQTIQQLLLNVYFNKIDMDEFVKKNVEKANAKRQKKGLPANTISTKANTSTKNIQQNVVNSLEETRRKNLDKVDEIKKSTEYYNNNGNKGSLAAKANMVAKYNEKNNKK